MQDRRMSETSLLAGWFSLNTLGARIDSRFWYGLAEQFRLADPAGELSVDVDVVREGVPCGPWTPSPVRHTTARVQFENLAHQAVAGTQLPVNAHNQSGGVVCLTGSVGAWLDIVWS